MKPSRRASSPVLATAAGQSAKSRSISDGRPSEISRCCARAAGRASAMVMPSRMHVSVSSSGRSARSAMSGACWRGAGQPQPRGFRAQPLVLRLLSRLSSRCSSAKTLKRPKRPTSLSRWLARPRAPVALQRGAPRAPDAARQADEAAHVLVEIVPAGGAFALGRAHLDPGQQTAEILIALAILHEERQPAAVAHADLRADERRDAEARAGAVEARRTVDAVGVHESDAPAARARPRARPAPRAGRPPRES